MVLHITCENVNVYHLMCAFRKILFNFYVFYVYVCWPHRNRCSEVFVKWILMPPYLVLLTKRIKCKTENGFTFTIFSFYCSFHYYFMNFDAKKKINKFHSHFRCKTKFCIIVVVVIDVEIFSCNAKNIRNKLC